MTSELVLLVDDESPIVQVVRMHRIIFDLLDLACLQRSPVNMAALFNGIAEKFALQARAGNIEIRVEAPDRPIIIGGIDKLA